MRLKHHDLIFLHKGPFPRKELIKNDAHRIDIRALIGRLPGALFGRHIARASKDHSLYRELSRVRPAIGIGKFYEPKIEDFHRERSIVLRLNPNVLGLQIPMSGALFMGVLKPFKDPFYDPNRRLRRGALRLDKFIERHPAQQLHREIGLAIHDPKIMDLQNIRMIETKERARLTLETILELRLPFELLMKDLHRNRRSVGLLGLIDRPHAPLPEDRDDMITLIERAADEAHDARTISFCYHAPFYAVSRAPDKRN